MFTPKRILHAAALAVLVSAASTALAQSQDHYGFGTPIGPPDLRKYFAIPADGSGLPPGSGTPAEGAKIYADNCAACHGDKGQGNPAKGIGGDRLLGGRGTLRATRPSRRSRATGPMQRRCSTM